MLLRIVCNDGAREPEVDVIWLPLPYSGDYASEVLYAFADLDGWDRAGLQLADDWFFWPFILDDGREVLASSPLSGSTIVNRMRYEESIGVSIADPDGDTAANAVFDIRGFPDALVELNWQCV